jgi:hypothetical protein
LAAAMQSVQSFVDRRATTFVIWQPCTAATRASAIQATSKSPMDRASSRANAPNTSYSRTLMINKKLLRNFFISTFFVFY